MTEGLAPTAETRRRIVEAFGHEPCAVCGRPSCRFLRRTYYCGDHFPPFESPATGRGGVEPNGPKRVFKSPRSRRGKRPVEYD